MKKNIYTLGLSLMMAGMFTQVAFSQSPKSAGKVFKEGADKDKTYTLGSDKAMNVIVESLKAYNTNDADKDLSFYTEDMIKKNGEFIRNWHKSMKTLNIQPMGMVPLRLKGAEEDMVFSWSQEDREWKDGSKQREYLFEIYTVNKDGKISKFNQFKSQPKTNEFGLADGGKIFLKDGKSTTFTFTNRGEVEAVEKMNAAFNKMDAAAVASFFTDSIKWKHSGGQIEKVSAKALWADYFKDQKSVNWKIEGILPFKMTDTDPASGIIVSGTHDQTSKNGTRLQKSQIITFAYGLDGKITEVDNFTKDLKYNPNKMADIKAEIIGLEKKWDGFYNTGDINSLIGLYADDAVRYPSNQPALIGKAAIKKDMELEDAKKAKGATITSETVDVIGNENQVTETGNSIHKNAAGKVVSVSKYMTVWQKVDGKFVAVREMWNENGKTK